RPRAGRRHAPRRGRRAPARRAGRGGGHADCAGDAEEEPLHGPELPQVPAAAGLASPRARANTPTGAHARAARALIGRPFFSRNHFANLFVGFISKKTTTHRHTFPEVRADSSDRRRPRRRGRRRTRHQGALAPITGIRAQ
ncbi:unnamed protein product, partial [Prorocentrum cordatum]